MKEDLAESDRATETEIKIRLPDSITRHEIESLLRIKFGPAVGQTDTVFAESKQMLIDLPLGSRVARIREVGGMTKVAVKRILSKIPLVREEVELSTEEPMNFKAVFEALSLAAVVVVKKTRLAAKSGSYQILFDCVEGLGKFLEIELLEKEPKKGAIEDAFVAGILTSLGLSVGDIEHEPYDAQLLQR